ncbi:MAG: [acyl-carrier-protein] S-malonyltransferase [Chthoniobacter sp.]|jgi:[acyl-carrier-protein] S-malonyltransferase|nr:[acyl-carrier-protein] S-malonyltransferase [Chthoniobacter sp.]
MTDQRIALLFAGQGAQTVGMGQDLAARYPAAAQLFADADQILGHPLSKVTFEGPEEELTQTKNCQPALFVHGLACLAALRQEIGEFKVCAAAGLSLGEFTAHAAAGTFDFETGLRLVARRGLFMQEACEQTQGGMAAMIGGDESAVRALAAECDVDVANLNSPGQIVISGESSRIALAVSLAKEHGIRVAKTLNVAGAYHSRLMNSAFVKLGDELQKTPLSTPRFPVICNTDARPVREPEEIRESLQDQVTGTVCWTQTLEYLVDEERCQLFIELGPGGVLAGLLNRTRKGTPCVSIMDCDSLAAALPVIRG